MRGSRPCRWRGGKAGGTSERTASAEGKGNGVSLGKGDGGIDPGRRGAGLSSGRKWVSSTKRKLPGQTKPGGAGWGEPGLRRWGFVWPTCWQL